MKVVLAILIAAGVFLASRSALCQPLALDGFAFDARAGDR